MTDGGNTWQPPQQGGSPPPPPPPAAAPAPGGFGPPTTPVPQPTAPVEPNAPAGQPASGGGRSKGKIVAATVGALAIVGAGVFAITRVSGDASAGGASSPEAAGEALLDALDNEDVLGAVDVLLPGERETFRQPMQDLVNELQRLEVLSDSDLSDVSGIDIVVTNREVTAEETNVDDIVNLQISATVGGSVDGDQLPIGDWIRSLDEAEEISELDEEARPETGRFPVTAVQKDGRWYLSLFYTVAEQARLQTDTEIPAEGIELNGGDSPEAAVDNLLAAATDLDLTGIVGTLNPNEFESLQRYAPLFIDEGQAQLDEAVEELGDFSIEISGTEYRVEGDGSRRSLGLTAVTAEVEVEGDRASIALADGCWLIEADGVEDAINSCDLMEDAEAELDDIEHGAEIQEAIERIEAIFEDYENPGLIVDEVDGAWYVSPLATTSDQVLAVLRALTREEIEELPEIFADLEEFGDDVVNSSRVDVPTLDDFELPGADDEEPLEVTPTTDEIEDTNATVQTPTDDTLEAVEEDPAEPCFAEPRVDDATACFEVLIAEGDIEAGEMPWYLRHPECGVGATIWEGNFYGLDDAEFIATIEAAQPCVQDLIAAGELSEFEVGSEFRNPECLNGRNVFIADDAVFDEYLDCAYD